MPCQVLQWLVSCSYQLPSLEWDLAISWCFGRLFSEEAPVIRVLNTSPPRAFAATLFAQVEPVSFGLLEDNAPGSRSRHGIRESISSPPTEVLSLSRCPLSCCWDMKVHSFRTGAGPHLGWSWQRWKVTRSVCGALCYWLVDSTLFLHAVFISSFHGSGWCLAQLLCVLKLWRGFDHVRCHQEGVHVIIPLGWKGGNVRAAPALGRTNQGCVFHFRF